VLARRGDLHVLVEVKTARLPRLEGTDGLDARFRPGLRVDWRRLRRLERARDAWARLEQCPRKLFRIELVEVALAPDGRVALVHHAEFRRPMTQPRPGATLPATLQGAARL
jgi:Holliday junction resolvase-like predicted endonuclease